MFIFALIGIVVVACVVGNFIKDFVIGFMYGFKVGRQMKAVQVEIQAETVKCTGTPGLNDGALNRLKEVNLKNRDN